MVISITWRRTDWAIAALHQFPEVSKNVIRSSILQRRVIAHLVHATASGGVSLLEAWSKIVDFFIAAASTVGLTIHFFWKQSVGTKAVEAVGAAHQSV
jgi:hypothetical protein